MFLCLTGDLGCCPNAGEEGRVLGASTGCKPAPRATGAIRLRLGAESRQRFSPAALLEDRSSKLAVRSSLSPGSDQGYQFHIDVRKELGTIE